VGSDGLSSWFSNDTTDKNPTIEYSKDDQKILEGKFFFVQKICVDLMFEP
jgi:hypothetical protein